jgi:excisionase family DNA binding protein
VPLTWEVRVPADDVLLTEAEVADLLRVSQRTVRRWRNEGTGPPALRVGRRIRYRRSAVEAWLDRRDETGKDS